MVRGGSLFLAAALFLQGASVRAQTTIASPVAPAEPSVRPPIIVGVAIDEVGMLALELQRSSLLILSLFDALPPGSRMVVASFSREPRIVLAPTADRALIASALSGLQPAVKGAALPDGLFDVVDYLGGLDAGARALLLVSPGRVREGDLHFEDPMNAAITRDIPIVALGLGQGDGKLLRRIARITRGEYIHIEVADARMLSAALLPRAAPAAASGVASSPPPVAESRPSPTAPSSAGLLGAAAVFLALGGLLILGTIVLLVRRSNGAPSPIGTSSKAPLAPPKTASSLPDVQASDLVFEEEPSLEKTLVVNVKPTLRALSGPGAGKNFPLSAGGQTSIGRSRRNDIVVPEDAASAQHCRIDREGDSYVLHDLGATNGTWVNGRITDRAVLQHGDRLKVGDTVFTVSLFGDRS